MFKKILSVALAYVGIIVGAGLSSGQDLMQYFVSFGLVGLLGVLVLAVLNAFFGKIILTLGSYYRSNDHSEVLSKIAHPITNKILDLSLIISCFVIGFVMIAGAGSTYTRNAEYLDGCHKLFCTLCDDRCIHGICTWRLNYANWCRQKKWYHWWCYSRIDYCCCFTCLSRSCR